MTRHVGLKSYVSLALAGLIGGCGGGGHAAAPRSFGGELAHAGFANDLLHARRTHLPPPQALVTDEAQNRLLVIDLPSGRVARRSRCPPTQRTSPRLAMAAS